MNKWSLLLLCTGLFPAAHAEMPQAEIPAEKDAYNNYIAFN